MQHNPGLKGEETKTVHIMHYQSQKKIYSTLQATNQYFFPSHDLPEQDTNNSNCYK